MADAFNANEIPRESRPANSDDGRYYAQVEFDSTVVEFASQCSSKLRLTLKAKDINFSEELQRELRSKLGHDFTEMAMASLHKLAVLSVLRNAMN